MKKGKLISVSLYEDFQVLVIEDIWVPLGHLKFAHRFLVVIVPCFVLSIRERWGGRLKCRGKSKFSEFCTMVRREYFWGQRFLLLCVFSKLLLFQGERICKKKFNFSSEIFLDFSLDPSHWCSAFFRTQYFCSCLCQRYLTIVEFNFFSQVVFP